MNTSEVAKKLAEKHKLFPAVKYDLHLREYDGLVELVGLIQDPTYEMKDFVGREMLFPKKWVTLEVFDPSYEVQV